jgi:3-oxo-5alpha-steroid 4-dehydrogenase
LRSDAAIAGTWDEEVDVAVIGFGGAGSAAAIEAAESGVSVLVIERFRGGGATKMSGGIMYSGGGSDLQKQAGFNDDPEEMFKYLACETGDAVEEQVLRDFCEKSVSNFRWVEGHGVPYPFSFQAGKSSYPSNETTLYYSGNECAPPYCEKARPAPRGHRALGKGLTGDVFYRALKQKTIAAGARIRYRTQSRKLITDDRGSVVGVEILAQPSNFFLQGVHELLFFCGTYLGALNLTLLKMFRSLLERFENRFGRVLRIRVKGGVVLASGGFIYNPEMTQANIPKYAKTMRLGTIGDSGSGITLGQSVGADVRKMERGTAWMFINPPAGLPKGILLSRKGERVCNEELYGAALGENIAEHHDGRAILLLDHKSWKESRNQIFRERKVTFQTIMGFINLYLNNRKSRSLEKLAQKCGMPADALHDAVDIYNAGVASGTDAMGKSATSLQMVDTPPYHAVNCDIDNGKFLTPSISLGGLSTDGTSGQVLRRDGSPIEGLYAAGRSAAGICSHSYVSGLAIADCIYSGRNAGRSAARAAAEM